jgi:hypothetical protein
MSSQGKQLRHILTQKGKTLGLSCPVTVNIKSTRWAIPLLWFPVMSSLQEEGKFMALFAQAVSLCDSFQWSLHSKLGMCHWHQAPNRLFKLMPTL